MCTIRYRTINNHVHTLIVSEVVKEEVEALVKECGYTLLPPE